VKFIARFNKVDRSYRVTWHKNTGCWKDIGPPEAGSGSGTKLEIIKG